MNQNFKTILFIISMIIISNWGAGLMVNSKEAKRKSEKTIKTKTKNRFKMHHDSVYLNKNSGFDKKRLISIK